MDNRLKDYLEGKTASYVMPSYWQHGKDRRTVGIPEKMREIYEDGARSICVESRPHPDFCGDEWWKDMDVLMSEAHKYGMEVWFFDDAHYPSGKAGGAVLKKPEMRAWNVAENHVDVIGPVSNGAVLLNNFTPEDILLGVYAYRRREKSEDYLENDIYDLNDGVKDGFVYFNLPKGVFRIFMIFKTRKVVLDEFIDVLRPEAVRLMIDEVYKPHYERYKNYVGNTFKGFFSDEPKFKNRIIGTTKQFTSYYHINIGIAAVALPWSDDVKLMIDEELGEDCIRYLPSLWYDIEGKTADTRYAFMNAVSLLYSKSFSVQLGNWCREHGLEYIGHVVEDMDNHARVGNGTAHFFRAMQGQDMSGMDIVLHQVLPGFAHYDNRTHNGEQFADSAFYHYVLAQMCASAAHCDKKKSNRALAEIYGAYGWALGLPMMKWIADFVTVRGINNYMIMAYNDVFPDTDCPPHFGAQGIDPQHGGMKTLFDYMNKTAHLLSEGTHVANVAILYHAEAEWMNRDGYMPMSVPAKILYDAHICYDIICTDTLNGNVTTENGKIHMNGESFDVLVVPYARFLPDCTLQALRNLCLKGADICFVSGVPEGCEGLGHTMDIEDLPSYCISRGAFDITVSKGNELLRHYHIKRGDTHVYFFFNESVSDSITADVCFAHDTDDLLKISVMDDKISAISSINRSIRLELEPYESVIIMANGLYNAETDKYEAQPVDISGLCYDISLADCENMSNYVYLETTDKLFNITGMDRFPKFSGKMRYVTSIELSEDGYYVIDLGDVGQTASLIVNGKPCGTRICKPYRFDIKDKLSKGINEIEINISNTLVHKIPDPLSASLLIPASGLIGPVRLWRKKKGEENEKY